ncbi:MAG TPA: glycosyltransferase family 4 protein [Candidatus Sumerlaeota bacterium]|nr:glycosyltransferase family 4 protein [Candidatus Sumerlaeota bacterium]
MPRVAFCFHHSQPSGATLWLKRLLVGGVAPIEAEAILPAESSVAEELRGAGIAVHVLGLEERAISEAGAVDAARLILNRVGVVSRYREIFRAGKFDVAYINTSVNMAPLIAARRAGVRALVHVHEIPTAARAFAVKRMLIRRWADSCLFASRRAMEVFGPRAPEGRRWEFSPNGVPAGPSALAQKKDELRATMGFARDEKIVLFAGNVSVPKGVHHLLQSWRQVCERIPRARLLLAGPHHAEKSDPIIDDAVAGKIPRVEALGFRNDVAELMAAADLFVLPSLSEAMPLSVIEAMMVCTPVIATDVGDVAWLLGDGRGVVYGNEKELAGILTAALEGGIALEDMANKAQAFALRELTSERQKKQVMEMIG